MSKNIETCKSEEVLSSVLDQQPQDYPSVQQAVHDLGVTALPAASAADPDIEELPSNVEVFIRRVLKAVVYDRVLPVVQQMWQAVWPRFADYLPDTLRPYASNPSLRTLGTLPTALSALSSRKISNGGATNDGIKDGESILHTICDGTATKLVDDNRGWTLSRGSILASIVSLFPSLTEIVFGCKIITQSLTNTRSAMVIPQKLEFQGLTDVVNAPLITMGEGAFTGNEEMSFPDLERMGCLVCYSGNGWWTSSISTGTLRFPKLKELTSAGGGRGAFIEVPMPNLKKLDLSAVTAMNRPLYGGSCLEGLEELWLTNSNNVNLCHGTNPANISTKLLLIDIKHGFNVNLNFTYWNPTDKGTAFLENFLHHIAERLAVGPTTNRLTLTLSADVYSACGFGATIDDPTDIRYQIKKAIQDSNWKVTDGTHNFNDQ